MMRRAVVRTAAVGSCSSRQLSTVGDTGRLFAKHLEMFQAEQARRAQQTMRVLEEVNRKEASGEPPKRIEDLIHNVVRSELRDEYNENGDGLSPQLSELFHTKKGRSRRSQANQANVVDFDAKTDTYKVRVGVDPAIVRTLLGDRFWRLRVFSHQTMCPIHYETGPDPRTGATRHLLELKGKSAQVNQAFELISNMQKECAKFTENVDWKEEHVVALNQGQNPKTIATSLEQLTGGFASLVPHRNANNLFKLRIWGAPSQLAVAAQVRRLIFDTQTMNYSVIPNGQTSEIQPNIFLVCYQRAIDAKVIPALIGPATSVVRRMKEDSRTDIKYSNMNDNPAFVKIVGSVENVLRALTDIDEFIRAYWDHMGSVNWKKQITIRSGDDMRRLCGKNMSELRKLQEITGALIRVSEPSDPHRSIKLWGRDDHVDHAIKNIYSVLKYGSTYIR